MKLNIIRVLQKLILSFYLYTQLEETRSLEYVCSICQLNPSVICQLNPSVTTDLSAQSICTLNPSVSSFHLSLQICQLNSFIHHPVHSIHLSLQRWLFHLFFINPKKGFVDRQFKSLSLSKWQKKFPKAYIFYVIFVKLCSIFLNIFHKMFILFPSYWF